MSQTSEPISSASLAPIESRVLYRCGCGSDFKVDPITGGICPACGRELDAEALRLANSATMPLENIEFDDQEQRFTSSSLELAAGTMLGHFRLEKAIGKGGMGAVYRAFDTSLERYVAVKVMRSSDQATEQEIDSMLREAVAQARLNHPNVVTIYYVGRHRDEPFLAMELVDGPTLGDRISPSGLPYETSIASAIQVVEALRHATLFGIVHADIKPSNLLLCPDGMVKLSDFGLSRIVSAEGSMLPIAGTPAYLAPELAQGEGVSPQSDMYALGVTLFEMVFGRLPFQLKGDTLREQLLSHRTAVIEFPNPWPTTIPRGFALLIERLLAKTPAERYPDYDTLLTDLRAVQPSSTTIAGIAPRAMAYGIDQAMLLLTISPFAAVIYYLNTLPSGFQAVIPLVGLLSLVVPITYLLLMRRGVPSLGRYLFQLRISEENGLPPGREQLLTREILRSQLAWLVPLGAYFSLYYFPMIYIFPRFVAVFMVAELICLLVTKNRRTLHDLLCRSRVVLKVDTPK